MHVPRIIVSRSVLRICVMRILSEIDINKQACSQSCRPAHGEKPASAQKRVDSRNAHFNADHSARSVHAQCTLRARYSARTVHAYVYLDGDNNLCFVKENVVFLNFVS